MARVIDDYISQLDQELRRRGVNDARTLAEAREHLIDAVEEGRQRGLSSEEAESEALERFGAPDVVAAHVLEERERMKTGFPAVLHGFWRRKWWIVVPAMAAAIVAGTASSYFMPTRYRAEARILVVPQRVPSGDLRTFVVSVDDPWLQQITTQVRSRTHLERIIAEFDLYPEERMTLPLGVVVERMRREIDVRALTSGVFSVSFVSSDPRKAMQVAERLATLFIDEGLKDGASRAEGTTEFFETEIAGVRRRLNEFEQTMQSRQAENGGRSSRADLIEFEVLQDRFKALLLRNEDAKTAANLERRHIGRQMRLLEAARMPETPVSPNVPRITSVAALLGLAIGLMFVVVRRSPNAPPPALAGA